MWPKTKVVVAFIALIAVSVIMNGSISNKGITASIISFNQTDAYSLDIKTNHSEGSFVNLIIDHASDSDIVTITYPSQDDCAAELKVNLKLITGTINKNDSECKINYNLKESLFIGGSVAGIIVDLNNGEVLHKANKTKPYTEIEYSDQNNSIKLKMPILAK